MTILEDPNGDARSLMNRRPCVCDGKASGIVCKYFWGLDQRFRAANSEAVRRGDVRRNCTMVDGFMLEFVEEEKPTFCSRYEPRKSTLREAGLVAIVKRVARAAVLLPPKAGAGYQPYDAEFDSYKPMTLEEIAARRAQIPDRPLAWQFGKDPTTLSAADIMNGPQINMLKPGEKPKGLELDAETEAALGSIFDSEPTASVVNRAEGGILAPKPKKDDQ